MQREMEQEVRSPLPLGLLLCQSVTLLCAIEYIETMAEGGELFLRSKNPKIAYMGVFSLPKRSKRPRIRGGRQGLLAEGGCKGGRHPKLDFAFTWPSSVTLYKIPVIYVSHQLREFSPACLVIVKQILWRHVTSLLTRQIMWLVSMSRRLTGFLSTIGQLLSSLPR